MYSGRTRSIHYLGQVAVESCEGHCHLMAVVLLHLQLPEFSLGGSGGGGIVFNSLHNSAPPTTTTHLPLSLLHYVQLYTIKYSIVWHHEDE